MKILVIDDDRAITQTLHNLLSVYHYAVDTAADGESGLELIEAFDYDLVLLDLVLPGLDGVALCRQIRAKGFKMPILLLTGRGETRQKTEALNTGADDYLVKPFDADELIARVQALLRRGGLKSQPSLEWGKLSLDPRTRKVSYDLRPLTLTPKEFAILELFLRNPQQVFSPDVILNHAWTSAESPGEESVRVHIKGLRQKLGAAGAPKDLIKTLHRLGYQLNPLYSEGVPSRVAGQLSPSNEAELTSVNQELRERLERLQAAQDELRQQYEDLAIAYRSVERDRQQLQLINTDLERQLSRREASGEAANHQRIDLPDQGTDQGMGSQGTPDEDVYDRWDILFNQADDAIAILDSEGRFIDINVAACRLLATSKDELQSLNITDFCCSDDDAAQLIDRIVQGDNLPWILRICCRDRRIIATLSVAIGHLIPNRHLLILREERA